MHIDRLIEQTRDIVKTQYEGMERLSMEESDPAILKDDLFEKLQAFIPGMTKDDMTILYRELQMSGDITLVSNDTVTFSKKFIGK